MPERYNFFELNLPYRDKSDYKKIVLDKIAPFIASLESKGLIYGFHFIMHRTLDLRIELKGDSLEPIKEECHNFDLPEDLKSYSLGSDEGVNLCYDALHSFSKLIIEMFRANLEEHLTHQLIHYLYIQQGIDNFEQIYQDIRDGIGWVDKIKREYGDKLRPDTKKTLDEIRAALDHAKNVCEGRAEKKS